MWSWWSQEPPCHMPGRRWLPRRHCAPETTMLSVSRKALSIMPGGHGREADSSSRSRVTPRPRERKSPARRYNASMSPGSPVTPPSPAHEREEAVRQSLRAVIDPELGDTIVDLGMVRAVVVTGGRVAGDVALTVAACPLRTQIEKDVRGQIEALDWVDSVEIRIATMDAEERAAVMARARWK